MKTLFFINLMVSLGFSMSDAYFSVYVSSLGMIFASAIGLYAASKIIFSPVAGVLCDRFSSRRLIIVSTAIYAMIAMLYMSSTNLLIVTALRMLQGVGTAIFRPVLLSAAGSRTPRGRRASSLGAFDVSFYLATAIGPVLGGLVKDFAGYTGLFIMLLLLCLAALAAAMFRLSPVDIKDRETDRSIPMSAIIRNPVIASLLFFIFGRAFTTATICIFLPVYLVSGLGCSGVKTGLAISATTLFMMILLKPMGRLADRLDRRNMILWGGGYVSLLVFVLPDVGGYYGVLTVCACIGLFSAMSQPASSSLLVEEGEKTALGRTAGMFNCVLNLGFASASAIGTAIYSALGVRAVFYSAAFVSAVAMIICSLLIFCREEEPVADIKTV